MARVVDNIGETIRELRSSIFELHHTGSSPSPGAQILAVCADERDILGFDPAVRFDGPVNAVGDHTGKELLAVLREALSNVGRHARAGEATVEVTVDHGVLLRVSDNGIGLPLPPRRPGDHSLLDMAGRAEKLGGTCRLRPGTPSGTILEWHIPYA